MKNHKLFYGSSYDRGLDILLALWPKILEKFPDATLDICYGWDLFAAGYKDNPERIAWMDKVNAKMKQQGITHHGRVGKKELAEIRGRCGIWAYPTYFTEINCITALDAQKDGLVPVTVDLAALDETVQSGIKIKVKDMDAIYDYEVQQEWLNALFNVMGWNEAVFKKESEKAQKFAKDYDWSIIAERWINEFGD